MLGLLIGIRLAWRDAIDAFKSAFEHFYHFWFDPEKISIFQVSVLPVGVRSGIVLPEDREAGKLEAGFEARLQVRVFEGWSRAPQE